MEIVETSANLPSVKEETSANLPSVKDSYLIKTHGIKDKRGTVAMAYVMLGISYIIPWAVFSTASPFYTGFKLTWVSYSTYANDTEALSRLEEYRGFFINYLGIVVQIPNLSGAIINLLFINESDSRPRIIWCLLGVICCNLILMVLALSDSRKWVEINILMTWVVVMLLGGSGGLLTSFVWGSSGDFRGLEIWINLGTSICGVLTALFSILSKVYATNSKQSSEEESSTAVVGELTPKQEENTALMYFMLSLVVCCITHVLYGMLRYNKYYRTIHREVVLKKEIVKKSCKEEVLKLKPVFKATWRLQIQLFYMTTVSLACNPNLQLGIQHQPDFPAKLQIYYYDILCFLTFYLSSMIGNFVTLKVKCPGPRTIVIPVVLRTLFVPILMFCNYMPEKRRTPVLFHHDSIHGITSFMLGFSNGYLLTRLMEHIAQKSIADGLNIGLAMKLGAVMILSGVLMGVLVGLMLAKFAVM